MEFRHIDVRLKRARAHLQELHAAALTWQDREHKPQVLVHVDAKVHHYVIGVIANPLGLDELPALFVDYCHDLKVALDYLAWQFHLDSGGSPEDDRVSYPVVAKERSWSDAKFSGVAPEFVAFLRGHQPFTLGNHCLLAIHDVDRLSKHRTPRVLGWTEHSISISIRGTAPVDLDPAFFMPDGGFAVEANVVRTVAEYVLTTPVTRPEDIAPALADPHVELDVEVEVDYGFETPHGSIPFRDLSVFLEAVELIIRDAKAANFKPRPAEAG